MDQILEALDEWSKLCAKHQTVDLQENAEYNMDRYGKKYSIGQDKGKIIKIKKKGKPTGWYCKKCMFLTGNLIEQIRGKEVVEGQQLLMI